MKLNVKNSAFFVAALTIGLSSISAFAKNNGQRGKEIGEKIDETKQKTKDKARDLKERAKDKSKEIIDRA